MKLTSFYSRRLHSLLGVIPLGVYLTTHMLANYQAVNGPKRFLETVEFINGMPLILLMEIFVIWLPLLYHGVYGLYIAYQARNNVMGYSYFRNQMFMWQRITGVLTLLFVAWHVFQTRIQVALGHIHHDELGQQMHEIAISPLYFAIYIIGIVATTFHFSNGLWSFMVSWGITVGPRAQRVSTYICMGIFVIMSVLFILAFVAFTGHEFAAAGSAGMDLNILTKIG